MVIMAGTIPGSGICALVNTGVYRDNWGKGTRALKTPPILDGSSLNVLPRPICSYVVKKYYPNKQTNTQTTHKQRNKPTGQQTHKQTVFTGTTGVGVGEALKMPSGKFNS
jgi:hypothetical protein